MRALFYPLIPYFAGLLGLASFTSWYMALTYAVGIVVCCILAVRFHDRHNLPLDDRLTDERIEKAIQTYIEEVKIRNESM